MTENAEQIELLKRKRTTLRSSVTKLINKIEAELKKTDVTEENDIELHIETLNDKFESLKLTDSNLKTILSLKDIDKELESAEEYCYSHRKSLPSNAGLMVGKRVLQGEAWSDSAILVARMTLETILATWRQIWRPWRQIDYSRKCNPFLDISIRGQDLGFS
ncbi:hypothetical protein AVEN_233564-1 [Araneus ventricosus]|uniref:Uncharacterized protein n=1 Tax=Araneus ventricosus TaxID=182803 RepID=A0A4Y2TTL1_ARAVE|nr:hypothetical protein AVEN_233564-1 [Araneus ventricosus]